MRKAVGVLLPGRSWTDFIIFGQFARPYTTSQVEFTEEVSERFDSLVAAEVTAPATAAKLAEFAERGGRVIVFGRGHEDLEGLAGIRRLPTEPRDLLSGDLLLRDGAECSKSLLRYRPNSSFSPWLPWSQRPLWRFDFEASWNVYGYGKILLDESPWALAGNYALEAAETLAEVGDGRNTLPFMTLRRIGRGAVLWVNRGVGLPDTIENALLVHFLSSWEPESPRPLYISPVPPGRRAAATFRFDCDEAIDSAEGVLQDYFQAHIPPSLAVTTREIKSQALRDYLRDITRRGGAVLSHSVDHAANWGGTYDAALTQATTSRAILEEVTALPVRNAVSPFHQNPPEAMKALHDAGYWGLATGSLDNAPEALLGWPGFYPGPDGLLPIALHEQMAMLHGDSVRHHEGLAHYKAAFEAHARLGLPFGFLDHPQSRYDYGWGSLENQRRTHQEWIGYLKESPGLWAVDENSMLDYLAGLQRLSIERDERPDTVRIGWEGPAPLRAALEKNGILLRTGTSTYEPALPEPGAATVLALNSSKERLRTP